MAFLDEVGLAHLWQKIKGPLYDPVNVTLQTIYPIGSVYISTQPTSPATLFGFGTWEQIQDVFLLAAGTKYQAGTTGGEATHKLTVEETPPHNHEFSGEESSHDHATFLRDENATSNPENRYLTDMWGTGPVTLGFSASMSSTSSRKQMRTDSAKITPKGSIGETGGGNPHNNMPPYLAVYVWERKE